MTLTALRLAALGLSGALALAACTPTEQGAVVGAAGGALVGSALSSDSDRDTGALVGAGLGAIAGAMIGQANTPGQCYYSDGRGGRYIAPADRQKNGIPARGRRRLALFALRGRAAAGYLAASGWARCTGSNWTAQGLKRGESASSRALICA